MTNLSNGKKIAIFAGIAVVVFGLVFGGIMLTKDVGKSQETITSEQAENQMNKLLGGI
ncbi:MAG: VWA domain-containing protein, partial [Ruminococcaceae bacterium]|nr:VWA domain-containing protein [Oscillospiraceae bacterium]